MKALTDSDLPQWIDNDEGLYNWWKQSKQSKTKFIKENKQELRECINKVLSGEKQAHYLKYGHSR